MKKLTVILKKDIPTEIITQDSLRVYGEFFQQKEVEELISHYRKLLDGEKLPEKYVLNEWSAHVRLLAFLKEHNLDGVVEEFE